MCLSFDFTAHGYTTYEEAMEAAEKATDEQLVGEAETAFGLDNQHSDISCDGTQIGLLDVEDPATGAKSFVQLARVPILSKTSVIAMLSARREDIGENHEYIVPCKPIPCLQSNLEAFMDPGDKVTIPIKPQIYRGGLDSTLASGNADEYVLPDIVLEEGKCVKYADGSVVMTLRTACLAETAKAIDAQIKAGKYRDRSDYLTAMKKAAWAEFERACKANKVDMKALFACTGEVDECGFDMVAIEAQCQFMENFYPCLLPGSDILVLLPPIKDGKAKMDAAFSLKLQYPKRPDHVWLPGLHHNDTSMKGDTYTQYENHFIYTNTRMSLAVLDPKTGIFRDIRLHQAHEFLPDHGHVKWSSLHCVDDDVVVYDYEAWTRGCTPFQSKRHEAMNEKLEADNVLGGLKLCHGGFNSYGVMTNLIGSEIPKECNNAKVCEFAPIGGSAHTRQIRELMKKRKLDKESKKRKLDGDASDVEPTSKLITSPASVAVVEP